jgi:hypothetical protein
MEAIKKAGRPKGTNKAKFGLYLDTTLMSDIEEIAISDERSINFMVEKALQQFIGSYPTKGKPR